MKCDECGAPAIYSRLDWYDPRTAWSNDVDADYSYFCEECADPGGKGWDELEDEDLEYEDD